MTANKIPQIDFSDFKTRFQWLQLVEIVEINSL
jgi:hypothetical protein